MSARLFAAIAFLAACQHSEGRYLRRTVEKGELIGSWHMTADAVRDLRDVNRLEVESPETNVIRLRVNGTCHFNTFFVGTGPLELIESDCSWSLRDIGHQALSLDFPDGRSVHYYFWKSPSGQLLIWQHLADPDAWRYIEYARSSDHTS